MPGEQVNLVDVIYSQCVLSPRRTPGNYCQVQGKAHLFIEHISTSQFKEPHIKLSGTLFQLCGAEELKPASPGLVLTLANRK